MQPDETNGVGTRKRMLWPWRHRLPWSFFVLTHGGRKRQDDACHASLVAGSVFPGLSEKVKPLADGRKIRLVVVERADHFFRYFAAEDAADAIAEFFGTTP